MIASAQPRWKPEKPITIYNPFAAGGVTDVHMRLLAEAVGKILGQQIIIDIKPGAAGTLAPAMLLNAKPDGYTLAVMSINTLRYPHYQQTNWNPLTDFTYITGLSGYTMGIVVRSDSPWKTFRGHDRRRQEGPGQVQLRHLGRGRHRPAHDDRGRAGHRRQVHPRPLQGRRGMDAGADGRRDPVHRRCRAMGAVRRRRQVPHPRPSPPRSASRATPTCRP